MTRTHRAGVSVSMSSATHWIRKKLAGFIFPLWHWDRKWLREVVVVLAGRLIACACVCACAFFETATQRRCGSDSSGSCCSKTVGEGSCVTMWREKAPHKGSASCPAGASICRRSLLPRWRLSLPGRRLSLLSPGRTADSSVFIFINLFFCFSGTETWFSPET